MVVVVAVLVMVVVAVVVAVVVVVVGVVGYVVVGGVAPTVLGYPSPRVVLHNPIITPMARYRMSGPTLVFIVSRGGQNDNDMMSYSIR